MVYRILFVFSLFFVFLTTKVSSQNVLTFKQNKGKKTKVVSDKKQLKLVEKQKKKEKKEKQKHTKAAKKQHLNNQGSTPAGRKRKKQIKKMERDRKKGKF